MKKGIVVLVVFTILAVFLTGCDGCKVLYKRDIRTLVDTQQLEGSFFLASGQVGTEYVYRFFEEVDENTYYERTVPASKAFVIEHESEELDAWVIHMYARNPEDCRPEDCIDYAVKNWYEIHVPKGTILPINKLDLE